jgi:periplasmic copper chaperone A
MSRRLVATTLLTVAALALAACGDDGDGGGGAVSVEGAWARTSPAMVNVGAAYMVLESDDGDRLLSASVDPSVAGKVEIHETMMMGGADTTMGDMGAETTMGDMGAETTMAEGGGAMSMQPIDSLELPAGEAVALEPGGYHLMLLQLAEPLESGDTIEITLTFETAGEQTVEAEVRDTAP